MKVNHRFLAVLSAWLLFAASPVLAVDYGLESSTIELASAGPLAFTPDGILIVGDPMAATIYAIDTEERGQADTAAYDIAALQSSLQDAIAAAEVKVADLAVHPKTKSVYLAVQAGSKAALIRVTAAGKTESISLDKVLSSKITLPNPPADKLVGRGNRQRNLRMDSITDLAFTSSRLLVSGLSADASPSTVLEYEFPFHERSRAFRTEIFHAAHGRVEDGSAIRTFIPMNIGGEPSLLAGFTCTPLVQFPVKTSDSPEKLRGKTIAELGNRNRPLDMILYNKGEQEYLLIANSARGVMKLATANIDQQQELTARVSGGGSAGLPFEQVASLEGVVQLDKLDPAHGVVLIESAGNLKLKSIELP